MRKHDNVVAVGGRVLRRLEKFGGRGVDNLRVAHRGVPVDIPHTVGCNGVGKLFFNPKASAGETVYIRITARDFFYQLVAAVNVFYEVFRGRVDVVVYVRIGVHGNRVSLGEFALNKVFPAFSHFAHDKKRGFNVLLF